MCWELDIFIYLLEACRSLFPVQVQAALEHSIKNEVFCESQNQAIAADLVRPVEAIGEAQLNSFQGVREVL